MPSSKSLLSSSSKILILLALDLLVVTSAWQGMDEQTRAFDPQAGNLFIYKTPYTGLVDTGFIRH